jgi:hypothetical protein
MDFIRFLVCNTQIVVLFPCSFMQVSMSFFPKHKTKYQKKYVAGIARSYRLEVFLGGTNHGNISNISEVTDWCYIRSHWLNQETNNDTTFRNLARCHLAFEQKNYPLKWNPNY